MSGLVLGDLVLKKLGLNLEVAEFFSQALRFDSELLTFLLAHLDLLIHQNSSLDSLIVL